MGPSRWFPCSLHGFRHRGGWRPGLDAALRALVPTLDLVRAWRRVGRCLVWVVISRLGVLDAFSVLVWAGTSLSCVKAFLAGCRGWVLTSYRVLMENRFKGPLRAFWRHVRWKACGRNAVDDIKESPITARCATMGLVTKRNPVYTYWPTSTAGCGGTTTPWLQPLLEVIGTTTNSWLILTLEVRSSTDPSDDSGITGVPTLPHQQRCNAI